MALPVDPGADAGMRFFRTNPSSRIVRFIRWPATRMTDAPAATRPEALSRRSSEDGACPWYPRRDSNARTRLRRPVLYPLSYGGLAAFYAPHRAQAGIDLP